MVSITQTRVFDKCIMGFIILNSVAMGMFNYAEDNKCIYDYGEAICPLPR